MVEQHQQQLAGAFFPVTRSSKHNQIRGQIDSFRRPKTYKTDQTAKSSPFAKSIAGQSSADGSVQKDSPSQDPSATNLTATYPSDQEPSSNRFLGNIGITKLWQTAINKEHDWVTRAGQTINPVETSPGFTTIRQDPPLSNLPATPFSAKNPSKSNLIDKSIRLHTTGEIVEDHLHSGFEMTSTSAVNIPSSETPASSIIVSGTSVSVPALLLHIFTTVPLAIQTLPVLTVGSQIYTTNNAGGYTIGTKTLPGSQIIVSKTTVSAPALATDLPAAKNSPLKISSQTNTANSSTCHAIGAQAGTPGSRITASGVQISHLGKSTSSTLELGRLIMEGFGRGEWRNRRYQYWF